MFQRLNGPCNEISIGWAWAHWPDLIAPHGQTIPRSISPQGFRLRLRLFLRGPGWPMLRCDEWSASLWNWGGREQV